MSTWKPELREGRPADLGGAAAVSTQQAQVVDLAVKTKLLLDSVYAWLLTQRSLVNVRRRALFPVAKERTQLADALARYLNLQADQRGRDHRRLGVRPLR